MAKKTWNEPIDKNVDWGGDENTGGLPVSGAMVQKFIKESLDGKAGLFHYDTANNRYVVFSDETARDIYLEDPTRTDLIIGTFDAPFNYSAEIHLETPSYNAIFFGATGNYIDFTYDVKNKQGASTGESVIITITFVRNSIKKTITQVGRPNERVHFNVDGFIDEGTNTIIIGVTGQTTLAATTVSVTYQVVNLQLSDSLDISKVYDLSSSPQTMEVPFSVSGYGTKVVEWYLDGALLPFVKSEDEVVDVSTERTKYIELSNLQQGRHTLQIRAYTTINGEKFYTNTLYRDIIIYTGVSTATILAAAAEIPHQYGILESLILYGITQYIPYNLRFASYSPLNKQSVQVDITLDGDLKGQVSSQNGLENSFTFVTTTFGNKTLVLNEQDDTYTIPVLVNKTSMSIEEITTALKLDFSAVGRSNNSTDKSVWEYEDYVGTFKGFNWNLTSGWVDNLLKMNAGSSFEIDYAPLSSNPTSTGKTIEIEFKTTNVNNDDTIICDLRNSSGAGILIRATKASLISANGVVVETEFKAEEMVRIGFVINKTSGTTRKCMSFLYANGCISRGVEWASTDNYTSEALIKFEASTGAEVELKSLRIYDTALSDDQILNNYTLYRDSIADMMDVYDRNNIYIDGTNSFSPDKAASRLPVMIVTGDIPTLENTSDTGTQIVVDIEYTNLQHPDKSFKMVGAAMRPQGTSSMGYPKKNFRIYTQKVDDTILYDSAGKVVPDKLYAFKDGAIPVNCWCLKADYAESSGTHNTGIARLWNEALFNMQVDGQYVCRTDAQKAAIENGYEYDVRTTIDGFPILLFYRPTANDEPIFIGKYNFNNDKSTEGVFGFTDIPGFNNEKMQCWEIRNNGNPLALFQTVDGFDSGWAEAYESRYPDTKTPYLGDLKAFSQWMVGVNGDHERFATEKWEHFKIYPMAAYYVYLMRHAAADQLAKNAMLTSEDGQHFYFIQYDNDTINGLNNLGEIDIPPTADRQSKDESGEYLFAAHESVLWNMLEADTEFMEIVKVVDNALYSAGISYANLIKVFDEEQSDKWVERVYNQDTEYKYIGPYVNQGINHLKKLQGKRDLHRRWWLSKRFSIYDAKFVSGEYKSQAIELKCKNDTPAGQQFTIRSGYKLDYGYGINAGARVTGITLDVGDYHTFTTGEVVNLGDPIRIYGSANIAELDLSAMANRLAVVTISYVYDEELGTKFKKLVLGGTDVDNLDVTEISGLKQAKLLEYLDIQGMKGITSLDLTSHPYLQVLKAHGSGLKAVEFAAGGNVSTLELPSSMETLILTQLPYLNLSGISIAGGMGNIKTLSITGCPNLSKDFTWVYNWYSDNASSAKECSLTMDNVDWKDVDPTQLLDLKNLSGLSLKGKVVLKNITVDQLNALMEVFGETAFNKNADFFIDAPSAIFVSGRTELLEGESEDYNCVVFGGEVERISWSIVSGSSSYTTINAETGTLSTTEGSGNRTIVIRVVAITNAGTKSIDTTVVIKARIYPSSSQTSISGSSRLESTRTTYKLAYTTSGINGDMVATWTLSGMEGYAEIESYTDNSCVVKKIAEATTLVQGTLSCALTKRANNSRLFTITKTIEILNESIAETDSYLCKALYGAGLCANETYLTKDEAKSILMTDIQPGGSSTNILGSVNIKNFDSFKYFESITYIPDNFKIGGSLVSITLPPNITDIGGTAFAQSTLTQVDMSLCTKLVNMARSVFSNSKITNLYLSNTRLLALNLNSIPYLQHILLPPTLTSINSNAVNNLNALVELDLSNTSISSIGVQAIRDCPNLKRVIFPDSLTTIGNDVCYNCSIEEFDLSKSKVTSLYGFGVNNHGIKSIKLPTSLTSIRNCFYNCSGEISEIDLTVLENLTEISLSFSIDGLRKIVIPKKVSSIDAIGHYINNFSIEVVSENVYYKSIEGVLFDFSGKKLIRNAIPQDYVIPEGVEETNRYAFMRNTFSQVTFPSTMKKLAEYSFRECPNLVSVDMYGTQISSIGNSCFENSKSLESVSFSPKITTLEQYCFRNTALKNVDLSYCNSLTYIGYVIFGNTPLEECLFPSTMRSLNASFFADLTNFKSLDLSHCNNFTTLPYKFCSGCTALTSVKLPDSLTSIEDYAFSGCTSLTSITLPIGVTTIGNYMFRSCTSLTSITCMRAVASEISSGSFGTSTSDYTGRNTYNTGENMLYVPQGATGYDSGAWLDPLQSAEKCGFTLSATL